jgi:uncharacterized 2Fe-2S/4Fe-4S cluster protein (DUF4445 family)
MHTIKITGLASGKIIKILSIEKIPDNTTLMYYLTSQGIPIASSCNGEGVCSKCNINNNLLSCQISLKDFIKLHPDPEIFISYL